MTIKQRTTAPLTAAQRKQLQQDAADIRATAARKNVTLDKWEEQSEAYHAKHHFELGCWLFYYSKRIDQPEALADRIDCMRRIFEAGFTHLGYDFFTVFDFGERQFDTLVEMNDGKAVIEGVRKYLTDTEKGSHVRDAFKYMGWPLVANGTLI